MPDARLERARRSLPEGYQFGDGRYADFADCRDDILTRMAQLGSNFGVHASSPLAAGAMQTGETVTVEP